MTDGAAVLRDCLQQLGAKRVEATLLSSLIIHGPLGTQEIVDQTGLRQPEVSVGMRMLRDRSWVEAETVPRDGKGRPMHKYRLAAAPDAIRGHYEAMGQEAIDTYQGAINVLRSHLDG